MDNNEIAVRHGKNKKKIAIIISICVIAFLLTGAVGTYLWVDSRIKAEPNVDNLDKVTGGSFNVLLVGRDVVAGLTDSMILVNINKDKKEISTCSLYRDTRVMVNGKRYGKLNTCYNAGKMPLLIDTIKELTGAPINYYVVVDTSVFKELIDTFGGVEFNVPQDMKYDDPWQKPPLHINLKEGMQLLDGKKAEQLVRFRHYVQGDVQRAKVQQDLIKAIVNQHLNASNVAKAPSIFKSVVKNIKTNMSLTDVMSNMGSLKLFSNDSVNTYYMPGAGMFLKQNGVKISYYIQDYDATYELFKEHFNGTGAPSKNILTVSRDITTNTKPYSGTTVPGGTKKTTTTSGLYEDEPVTTKRSTTRTTASTKPTTTTTKPITTTTTVLPG